MRAILLLPIVFLVLMACVLPRAHARDRGQFAGASPEIREWIGGLRNQGGTPCCAFADGWQPDAVDWDVKNGRYRVLYGGAWLDVSADAVLEGPNRLGHAIVWVATYEGVTYVRCFLPGPLS